MENLIKCFVFSSILIFAGCGVSRDVTLKEGKVDGGGDPPGGNGGGGSVDKNKFIQGSIQLTTGQKVDLYEDLKEKPLVLVFSADLCTGCFNETVAFVENLQDKSQPPRAIHLVTILLGGNRERAAWWKNEYFGLVDPKLHPVPWPVGVDVQKDPLFRKYCAPNFSTPCTLIQMPGKGIVESHKGQATTVEDINKFTGNWGDNR